MKTKNIKLNEKQLKKLNSRLLKHLQSALEIMSITKCPYFILNGYGSIFMDESYIKRHSINISNEESANIQIFKTKKEKDEYYDKRLEFIADEVKELASKLTKNSFTNKESIKEKEQIKIGTTLNDLLENKEQKKLDISLEKSNEIIETIPNITKDQAIEQVKFGQKTKNYDFINDANKSKAKSKIEEYYKAEDKK